MKVKQTGHLSVAFLALVLLVLSMSFTLLVAPDVYAATCDKNETVVIDCGNDKNGLWQLLLIATNVLAAGVGIFAVGGIVYGAILLTTAEDKAEQISKAKSVIGNVVLGLIVFALTYAGLQFFIPGGVFDREYSGMAKTNIVDGKLKDTPAKPKKDTNGASPNGSPNDNSIALRNFRDASTSSGGSVLKPGMLFRAPALERLSAQDARELGQLMDSNGLIIDLRTSDTVRGSPDKSVPGARNINIPISGILDTTPMVTDGARRAQLGKALKAAANARGPVLIHCAAGKDRTGWSVAMIMYVAGASDAQVMKEYLKSNDEPYAGSVKRAWLQNGLQALRSKYGSTRNYLKAAGMSEADIKKLANKFGA